MTDVYFATNRTEPRGNRKSFGDRFNSEGPHFYEVGRATVTWGTLGPDGRPSDPEDFKVDWKRQEGTRPKPEKIGQQEIPETHRKQAEGEEPGSYVLFKELQEKMRPNDKPRQAPLKRPDTRTRDALVFIHGFANSFENALGRAAWLGETYLIQRGDGSAQSPYVFAFSWPSDGMTQPPWKYASDRDDAAMSGIAMARALRRFLEFLSTRERCSGRIHLVAHSMGNWALRHAVLGLHALQDGGRLEKIFDNAFLMAADEDEDCLESTDKLGLLPQLARRIHVYHSRSDLALEVSDRTKFNVDRLGTDGPRTLDGLSHRITAIDCSDVDATDLTHGNHQYYRLRPEVIADVRHVLAGQMNPEDYPTREPIEPGRRYRITPGPS
ncbi:alpha/beta hydrolase [Rhodovibrio salinarum]|nr:alpha/beta fold hydrolase [Rhodovibrio salinarum]